MNKVRVNNKGRSLLTSICCGAGISVLLALIAGLITSLLISNETIDAETSKYIVPVGLAVSTFIGVMTSKKIALDRQYLAAGVTGGVYYFAMLAVGMLFFDAKFGSIITGFVSCAVGAVVAIFVNYNAKTSTSIKNKRRHYR